MAAVRYTAATAPLQLRHRPFTTRILNPSKTIVVISSISASFPTKPSKRKNCLRQKILKTRTKPFIPIDSPPLLEIKELEIQEIQEFDKSESTESGIQEIEEVEELREVEISEYPGVIVDGSVGKLDKNPILKYGLWLVGAFVFQTVCAVWVFRSADIDSKNGILNGNRKGPVLEVGRNGQGESRVKLVLNGNVNGKIRNENGVVDSVVCVDEVEMERKIEEIRVMAREAREKERLESKNNALDSKDNNDVDVEKIVKSGIEEEVDNRLIKLRKKLENTRDKMPIAAVGHLRKESERKDGVEEGELNESEGNEALIFKKKYKFEELSSNLGEKPKGFTGLDDYSIHKSKESENAEKGDDFIRSGNSGNDAVNLGGGEKQLDLADVDSKGSDAVYVVEEGKNKDAVELTESIKSTRKKLAKERGTRKQVKGTAIVKPKGVDDIAHEKDYGKSAVEPVKSRESRAETVEIGAVSNKLAKGNDVLKGKEVASDKSTQKFDGKKRESETELWWSNLPCVLGILMYRGHDGAGGQGLYTLKNTSSTDGTLSHMVAFEDNVDATNFCYILRSFFEDLEDFKAGVVPLTVKELNEAVKSETMRVTVVKRGQLRLYEGQPLADAEMALRAMFEQG